MTRRGIRGTLRPVLSRVEPDARVSPPALGALVILENLLEYSTVQFQVVANVLTLGAAVFLAALVFFLVTTSGVAPRYRLASGLSAVVMVSAFLELGLLALDWRQVFTSVDGVVFARDPEGGYFSNGYRYMNWSIDVPVLLTQLLIVLGITGRAFFRKWIAFVVGGLLMVWTGYVGQFYEVDGGFLFYFWGSVSTVFFIWIAWVAGSTIFRGREDLPAEVRGLTTAVWWVLIISWTLYPIAYLLPQISDDPWSVVARQLTFTTADVVSKAVYGVLLTFLAQKLSSLQEFEPARIRQEATVGRPA